MISCAEQEHDNKNQLHGTDWLDRGAKKSLEYDSLLFYKLTLKFKPLYIILELYQH